MKNFFKLFTKDVNNITDNSPLAKRRAILEKIQDADAKKSYEQKFEIARKFAEQNFEPQKAGV